MKKIKLTQGQFALIDDDDFDKVMLFKWHARKEERSYGTIYYAIRSVKGKSIQMHTFIFGYKNGYVIDHKDGNTLNNQKSNLRFATVKQNTQNSNKSKNTKNKYKGVYLRPDKNKFQVRIKCEDKLIQLGYFKDEIEAAEVYNIAALKYFGEFAKINKF